jgi:MFS family permease
MKTHALPQKKARAGDLLDIKQHLLLSCFWFSLNFQSAALLPIVIPLQVVLFVAPGAVGSTHQAVILGWLAGVGAVLALVVMPLAGLISDRTRTPIGRRRPYILAGASVMIVCTVILAYAYQTAIFLAALGIMLFASNVTNAAYQGLLPDLVPEEQRGAASGYMGLMTILGNVGSLAVAALLLSQVDVRLLPPVAYSGIRDFYLLASFVLAAGMGMTVLGVREAEHPHLHAHAPQEGAWYRRWAQLWLTPLRQRNFAWVFTTRAAVMLGLTLFMTFIEYYFANVVHVANFVQATAAVALMALLGAVLSAITLGFLSDRVGRVPVVFFSTGCMAAAALTFVVFRGNFPLWPLGVLFGLGYGAYTSVDWALAIDVLPSQQHAGKDMGLWSLASTVPAIIAPLLGSTVISFAGNANLGNGYRAVFALAAFFLVLGALFVLLVKETPRGRQRERTQAL